MSRCLMVHGMIFFLVGKAAKIPPMIVTMYKEKHDYRYGNWGVCFTYGTWFALGGLAATGKTYKNCLAVRKAVDFLLRSQRPDGGWGESYLSCPEKVIFV